MVKSKNVTYKVTTGKTVSVEMPDEAQKAHDSQMSIVSTIPCPFLACSSQATGLFEGLMEREDITGSFASLEGAAWDIAEGDCPNGHKTPIKNLLAPAIERAKQRDAHTTDWDWKADSDTIRAELNRVLNPRGLRVQYPSMDMGDSVVFEFVPIDWRCMADGEAGRQEGKTI